MQGGGWEGGVGVGQGGVWGSGRGALAREAGKGDGAVRSREQWDQQRVHSLPVFGSRFPNNWSDL